MFGAPFGRQLLAIEIGVVEKVHVVDDDALLGRVLALEHPRPIDDAGVLLNHVVAGAGRHVVAVGPDRRTRIVRKERPHELVSIVWAERVGPGAQRVAHRERPERCARRRGSGSPAAATTGRRRDRVRRNRRRCRRFIEALRTTGLSAAPRHAARRRLARSTGHRLGVARRQSRKDRHDDQPAIGKLVVPRDGVAVVVRFARAAKSSKDIVRRDGAIENLSRGVELLALLREDRRSRIHDLHDVIGPDGDGVVRGIAQRRRALRSRESLSQSIKARDELR